MATKCEIEITKLEQYLELKEQGFEFEGQSYLFWEYMRILTDIRKYNPDVIFLLENVEMGSKWERVLSEAIGIFGVHINSALVSAQNRKRIYWTNVKVKSEGLFGELYSDIEQPEDRGILLRDILEYNVDEKYFLSDKVVANLEIHKQRNKEKGNGFGVVYHKEDMKMAALKIVGKGIDDIVCIATQNYIQITGTCFDSKYRFWFENGKHAACVTRGFDNTGVSLVDSRLRRLTPTECARLQTIPSWYKWECSETQQYKLLGNGWTIEVIKHIFKWML